MTTMDLAASAVAGLSLACLLWGMSRRGNEGTVKCSRCIKPYDPEHLDQGMCRECYQITGAQYDITPGRGL